MTPVVTPRPENRFEYREGRGETCEGCNDHYTRLSYAGTTYRCPKCESYMLAYDALAQSYAVLLEAWRTKFGLSREGALAHAREFDGFNDDIRDFLMDGYSMREYEEELALLRNTPPKFEAAYLSSYVLQAA